MIQRKDIQKMVQWLFQILEITNHSLTVVFGKKKDHGINSTKTSINIFLITCLVQKKNKNRKN